MLLAWSTADCEMVQEVCTHTNAIMDFQILALHTLRTVFEVDKTQEELYTCSSDKLEQVGEPLSGECEHHDVLRFNTLRLQLYSLCVHWGQALFAGELGQASSAVGHLSPLPCELRPSLALACTGGLHCGSRI